jgi:predicted Zn-dependent protease
MQNSRLEKLLEFYGNNPKDSFVTYAIATEYVSAGNDAEAYKYYSFVRTHDPDYVATYYHLGKWYERNQMRDEALAAYQDGMVVAKKLKDNHSLSELQNAWNNLEMGLDDY